MKQDLDLELSEDTLQTEAMVLCAEDKTPGATHQPEQGVSVSVLWVPGRQALPQPPDILLPQDGALPRQFWRTVHVQGELAGEGAQFLNVHPLQPRNSPLVGYLFHLFRLKKCVV